MAESTQPRPRRRVLRWVVIILAVLVILPVAGLAIFLATFDLNGQRPRIEAAVQDATGRKLELLGPIGLAVSLTPTLTVRDAHFANMPGGSRPEMASIRALDVQLAILPLLSNRIEVKRLELDGADILLETDAQGRPNWVFAPAGQPQPPAQPAEPKKGGALPGLAVGRIAITNAVLAYRDGRTRETRTVEVASLELRQKPSDGTLELAGDLSVERQKVTLAGAFGALSDLTRSNLPQPWPMRLTVEALGARLGLEGSIARPAEGKGWRVALNGRVPELARLAALMPGAQIPALRNIELAVAAADSGAVLPEISDLRLTIGESDLAATAPGLRLNSLEVRLPRPTEPISLNLQAVAQGAPVRLAGTLGAPALVLPPGTPGAMQGPYPVDLTFTTGTATASLKGQIANPVAVTGVDLNVAVRMPDLAVLTGLTGQPMPPLRDLSIDLGIAERGAAFANGALIKGLKVTSSAADVAGDLTIILGQRKGVNGRLASQRINLDQLQPPAGPRAQARRAPPPPARNDGRVIPDTPLPLDALKLADADLRWTIGQLTANGVDIRDVLLAVLAADGKARLDPFAATLPGGRIEVRAAADATASPPVVQGSVKADGIDLPALLNALKMQGMLAAGRLELDLDLRGRGTTVRQIAGSAFGHTAIALTSAQTQGQDPNSWFYRTFREVITAVPGLPELLARRINVACIANRFEMENGQASSRALLIDSQLGKIAGGGGLNLANEQIAMRLETDLALPLPGVSVVRIRSPIPVGGTFAAPQFNTSALAANAAASAATSLATGLVRGGAGVAGGLVGALGGNARAVPGQDLGGGSSLPDCGPQLAIVRAGRPGPVPASAAQAPAAAPAPQAQPSQPAAPAVPQQLRNLFGR